jgi:hypothetical protein
MHLTTNLRPYATIFSAYSTALSTQKYAYLSPETTTCLQKHASNFLDPKS